MNTTKIIELVAQATKAKPEVIAKNKRGVRILEGLFLNSPVELRTQPSMQLARTLLACQLLETLDRCEVRNYLRDNSKAREEMSAALAALCEISNSIAR
jgi:hypothetical protein